MAGHDIFLPENNVHPIEKEFFRFVLKLFAVNEAKKV